MFIISQRTLIAGRGMLRYQNVCKVLFRSNYTVSSLVLAQMIVLEINLLDCCRLDLQHKKRIKVLIK